MTNLLGTVATVSNSAGILALLLSLSACSETFYYKTGGNMRAADSAEYKCEVSSLEKAPVAHMRKWTEKCSWEEVCDKDDDCDEVYVCERESEIVDANEELRDRLMVVCMEDRGYTRVSLPECSNAVRKAVTPRPTVTMPPLTENTCYIRYNDGSIHG